jgi:hypothetical protein
LIICIFRYKVWRLRAWILLYPCVISSLLAPNIRHQFILKFYVPLGERQSLHIGAKR